MNKKILKYVLRGIIAFGTVNLLHGVSLKIVEQKQGNSRSQKTVQRSTPPPVVTTPVSILPTNNPVVDLAGLNCPAMVTLPVLEQNIQISLPVAEELKNTEQSDKQAPKNMFVIAKNGSPEQVDALSEKHKKNYQFPRIYRQVSPAKPENQKIGDITEQQDSDNYSCFSGSESSSPRYNGSHSSNHRSNAVEDEMLNQLIQGMLAQENSGTANGGSTRATPQNYAATLADTAPKNSTCHKNVPQRDTVKKEGPNQSNSIPAANTGTTTTSSILTPYEDPAFLEEIPKKLKKKNKREKPEQKQEQKNPAEKTIVQAPVTPDIPEQKVAETPIQPEIPAELVECNRKFNETINSAAPDAKIIDDFYMQSINWITAARKNLTDKQVQKNLAGYKRFIEQKVTECDQIIANIRAAKEGTETEKNMVCQWFSQIRSLYENMLKAFDATPEQASPVQPEPVKQPEQPKQENQPEKNILDRTCDKIERWCNTAAEFIDNHKPLSTLGFLGGISAWLGAKYFTQQKKTTGKQP